MVRAYCGGHESNAERADNAKSFHGSLLRGGGRGKLWRWVRMMSRCDIRCDMSARCLIPAGLVVFILLTTSVVAQQPAQWRGGRGGAGQTIEKIRLLKPNLYMVTGGGANTLIRVTPEGLIVVDTKNPGDENFNRLMEEIDRKSTRLNSSHLVISYAVFCLKKKT